jgi:ABC-type nitrate/sulfonate/bicarbonate transport system permease component
MRKASTTDDPWRRARLALYQALLLGTIFAVWYLMTEPVLVSEEFARNTAFFFGKPVLVLQRTIEWFVSGKIYEHLLITLVETLLAFAIGTLFAWARAYGSHSRPRHLRSQTHTLKR